MPEQHELTALIWRFAGLFGRNAPKIADRLLETHFPSTFNAAKEEGASTFLRRGLIKHVARTLRVANDDASQADMAEIDPAFRSLARNLKSNSYYVESLAEHVPLARLIASPDLLDDARRYMRKKGMECLEEARRLDALHAAVVGVAA